MLIGFVFTKLARGAARILWIAAALAVLFTLLAPSVPTRAAGSYNTYFPLAYSQEIAFPVSFPNPANYQWAQVASGIPGLTSMAVPGDGSGRLFVTRLSGQISIIKNGALLPTPFLDITSRVGWSGNEQGLLGLAFDPSYFTNGRFYVYYTDSSAVIHLSRFTRSAINPDLADDSSESILFTQPHNDSTVHFGGQLAFGPDGYLYISVGDGGPGGDPNNNAQNLDTLLGKILRINVKGASGYTIPAGNPFSGPNQRKEIWAYGLRNPWRFSFDRSSGDLLIADVGQESYEEINFQKSGASGGRNYGWHYREGLHPYTGTPPAGAVLTDPIYEYDHSQGCSITGGYVYRGLSLPEFRGIYLYADFCQGKVWGLRNVGGQWINQPLFQPVKFITSFGQDESGELYILTNDGLVLKLVRK